MPFTCSNARFRTNTAKGHPHGQGKPAGSVFQDPVLTNNDGYTLWLEYVEDRHGVGNWDTEPLWLMWYSPNGHSAITASSTFDRSALRTIAAKLIDAALP